MLHYSEEQFVSKIRRFAAFIGLAMTVDALFEVCNFYWIWLEFVISLCPDVWVDLASTKKVFHSLITTVFEAPLLACVFSMVSSHFACSLPQSNYFAKDSSVKCASFMPFEMRLHVLSSHVRELFFKPLRLSTIKLHGQATLISIQEWTPPWTAYQAQLAV